MLNLFSQYVSHCQQCTCESEQYCFDGIGLGTCKYLCWIGFLQNLCFGSLISLRNSSVLSMNIWLESTRKYIPISRMSPNHVQSGHSPGLIFSKKCTNPFAFFQWKVACREYVKHFQEGVPKNLNFRFEIGYNWGYNIKYTW